MTQATRLERVKFARNFCAAGTPNKSAQARVDQGDHRAQPALLRHVEAKCCVAIQNSPVQVTTGYNLVGGVASRARRAGDQGQDGARTVCDLGRLR